MSIEALSNAPVIPFNTDCGLTLKELYTAVALHGLASDGELVDAGRRAEMMAEDAIVALDKRSQQ